MQIVDFVSFPDPGGDTARTVARFAIATPDMRLSGFRLRLRPNGSFIVAAPFAGGVRLANFSPAMFRQINEAAEAAYRGLDAIDRRAA